MSRVAIALGSNVGDRLAQLRHGIAGIAGLARIVATSHVYETAPVGGPEQGPYLNAVVLVGADLALTNLLERLLAIEEATGRQRREKWGPRTLDLDIVAWDGPAIDQPGLTVPHPRAIERRFVLEPLAEVWPEAPVAPGVTALQALAAVAGQEVALTEYHLAESKGRGWVYVQTTLLALFVALLVVGASSLRALSTLLGVVLALSGGALLVPAVRSLGSNLTPFPRPVTGGTVTTSGPYRLVRHPIYGGLILGCLGLGVLFRSVPALMVVPVLTTLFWFKAKEEERRMLAMHPEYQAYRQTVRHRLLPWMI